MAERRQRKGANPRSAAKGESSVKNEETNMAAPTTRLKPKWSDSHPPEGMHTQIMVDKGHFGNSNIVPHCKPRQMKNEKILELSHLMACFI